MRCPEKTLFVLPKGRSHLWKKRDRPKSISTKEKWRPNGPYHLASLAWEQRTKTLVGCPWAPLWAQELSDSACCVNKVVTPCVVLNWPVSKSERGSIFLNGRLSVCLFLLSGGTYCCTICPHTALPQGHVERICPPGAGKYSDNRALNYKFVMHNVYFNGTPWTWQDSGHITFRKLRPWDTKWLGCCQVQGVKVHTILQQALPMYSWYSFALVLCICLLRVWKYTVPFILKARLHN